MYIYKYIHILIYIHIYDRKEAHVRGQIYFWTRRHDVLMLFIFIIILIIFILYVYVQSLYCKFEDKIQIEYKPIVGVYVYPVFYLLEEFKHKRKQNISLTFSQHI